MVLICSAHTIAGTNYTVNRDDFASRNFTVNFLSKEANSTEYVVNITDDQIFEGREYFRLRISAVRLIGQAAQFFAVQAGVNNTFVDISIEDDDSKAAHPVHIVNRIIANDLLFISQAVASYSCTGQLDNITSYISD